MKLSELFQGMKHRIIGDPSIEIRDLKYDSRQVERGDLFFCIAGFNTDGHVYAPQAAKAGAVAIVVTEYQNDLKNTTQVLVENDRRTMALCAAKFFQYPARELKTVGITGTNGKTTTTYMLKRIMEAAGWKTGLIGTIVNMIGDKEIYTAHTTPESIDLQRLLRRMVDEGCDALVMEVSSHSLQLDRVYGIEFDVGVFTNLSQDHLDFHKTWEEYIAAKSKLFEQSQISIINADDDAAANMMMKAERAIVKYGYAHPSQYTAKNVRLSAANANYDLEQEDQSIHISVPIPGVFTVYNSMAAAVTALELGIDSDIVVQALASMPPVAGRFELLDTHGRKYVVILDYAHSPDSLKNTLETIREFVLGRIITVFGCGGNRDAGKRPLMGEIAGRFSDFSIITSDNPRYEEPRSIMNQIETGMKNTGGSYICIENRRDAIQYALDHARQDDIILLAGKGHESYQEICGVRHNFDEKVVVEEILQGAGNI